MRQIESFSRRSFAAALLAFNLIGCGGGGGGDGSSVAKSGKLRVTNPAVPAEDRKALAEGNAAFAIDLYAKVAAERSGQNVVVSPASVSLALAMTYAGARGETEAEMARALRFTLPQARLHAAMDALDLELAARGQGLKGADGRAFQITIANGVWAQRGFTLLPTFLDVLAESYGAGVNLVDFMRDAEGARRNINGAVAKHTEDKVQDLLPPGVLDGNTRLVLTNAVYFNAAWKTPFGENTAEGTFKRLDGREVKVPMMSLETTLPYAAGVGFQAVALPYQDERLSLLLIAPDAGKFAQVEADLNAAKLDALGTALTPEKVRLVQPRFKFESAFALKDALSALGMPQAFGGEADFSGIDGSRSLLIQAVQHEAFIAVGEKGTEAAASTAVAVGRKGADLETRFFGVDRPFLFVLRDGPTGAILFIGRVLDPSVVLGG